MQFLTLTSDFSVILSDELPETSCWKRQVYVSPLLVTLVSQVSSDPHILPHPTNFPSHTYSVPVLKSNLQKAVRQGKPDVAVATTFQLLQQGRDAQTELLRRLPIILLEDTLLHGNILPRWIWYMMAHSQGYVPTKQEWEQLLGDVAFVASSEFRDKLTKQEERISSVTLDSLHSLPDLQKTCLFSIWVRSQWGGMNGDMAWLRGLFTTWLCRSASDWYQVSTETPVSVGFPKEFGSIHKLPEAVDFHCCTAMRYELAARLGVSEREIQETIWWHRSEPNFRVWFRENEFHQQETFEKRKETRELFASLEYQLSDYVQRMWKGRPIESRQTSIFQYIKQK